MSDALDESLLDNPESQRLLGEMKRKQQEQKIAIEKIRKAESDYIETVTKISNNLHTNPHWKTLCMNHVQEGTMAFIRAVSNPGERQL
jgi:hypothetical protein